MDALFKAIEKTSWEEQLKPDNNNKWGYTPIHSFVVLVTKQARLEQELGSTGLELY